MRRRVRTPLVLAVIAVALAAYIGIVERRRASTDQARAARIQVFPGLSRASLTEIAIDRGARGASTLVRVDGAPGGGHWKIMPADRPAAAGAVADLLDAIDALEIDRESTADARAAGLQPPAARLTMTSSHGPAPARLILEVGAPDATGRGAFVRRAGEARTLVVGRRLRDLVDQDPAAFRERRLFAPGVVEASDAIAYREAPGAERTLRKRDGRWLTGEGYLAKRAAMTEVVRALAGLEASGFPVGRVPPEPPPRWTLALGSVDGEGNGAAARLQVWQRGCAGKSDPPQWLATVAAGATHDSVCLLGDTVERIWRQLAAADRAEPHLLPIAPAEVDGVVLSEGARKIHLRRDPSGGWRLTDPAVSYAADAARIDEWLARLARVELADQRPTAGHSAPSGARRLILEGAQRAEIVVAPPRAGRVRVERAGELGAATAPAALFAELDPDPLRFRSRVVLELPRLDVTAIDLRTPAGSRHLQRGPGDRWTDPSAADLSPAVEGLLGRLANLEAERFVSQAPPLLARDSLEVSSQAGETSRKVRLEIDDRCRARLTDTPVFTLAPDLCESIRTALKDLVPSPVRARH